MNVASEDLCRELYKLSDWGRGDDDLWWWDGELIPPRSFAGVGFPAYDLGYLLRKLPASLPGNEYYFQLNEDGVGEWWGARYWDSVARIDKFPCVADTPEDAACKLAIELFRQNILQNEQQ